MDLDAFAAVHRDTWVRLEELTASAPTSGAAADELVDLYQEVATHLSIVRSQAPDPTLVPYLSGLLARARLRLAGTRGTSSRSFAEFFTRRFPAALYLTRRWWMTTMLVSYALTGLAIWWLLAHPAVEQTMFDPVQVDQLVNSDFENYYSESAHHEFAAQVWTNNAWVSAKAIAMGVFGLPVIFVLAQNMLNLAVIGSLMISHDRSELFWGLILPHGLLELTAVFVACGVGLRLFWAWVRPTAQSRLQALAREGRAAIGIAAGLVVVLLISGVIEGFVTPSGLPTWARVGIGVVAEIAFLAYVYLVGRRAAAQGWTGDLDESLLEAEVATAD